MSNKISLNLLVTSLTSFRKSIALSSLISLVVVPWALAVEAPVPATQSHGQLGATALKILYAAMSDTNGEVRVLATRQWGPIRNRAAKQVLLKALKDKNPYVRIAASESLFEIGETAGIDPLREFVQTAPPEPGEETNLGAILMMRRIALNKVRIAGINALSRMGNAASKKLLRELLGDADASVRDAAAVALARQGEDGALSGFIEALGNDDAAIRERAVRALGEAPTPRTVDMLKPFANDPSPSVRASIMEAIGNTRSMRAIPMLERGLKDENALVRSKAVEGLGRIPSSAVIAPLRAVHTDAENVIIELHAAAGLARLGEHVSFETARSALAQRDDQDTRLLAIAVFEEGGGPAALKQLSYSMIDEDHVVKVRAAAALLKILHQQRQKQKDLKNKR